MAFIFFSLLHIFIAWSFFLIFILINILLNIFYLIFIFLRTNYLWFGHWYSNMYGVFIGGCFRSCFLVYNFRFLDWLRYKDVIFSYGVILFLKDFRFGNRLSDINTTFFSWIPLLLLNLLLDLRLTGPSKPNLSPFLQILSLLLIPIINIIFRLLVFLQLISYLIDYLLC